MSATLVAVPTNHRDTIQDEIVALLNELPMDAQMTVKQFVMFLSDKSEKQNNQHRTQIITVPASSLIGLTGLLTPGYEGNALEDTEALYDEV